MLRQVGVREYLMIGTLAITSGSLKEACPEFALQQEHEGYTRTVVEEVSHQLLHVTDAQRDVRVPRGTGICCAVSYRKDS